MTGDSVRWFGDIGLPDRPLVGGKGASLGELTRAGMAVPPGFVVTTAAFQAALAAIDPGGDDPREHRAAEPQRSARDDAVADSIRRASWPARCRQRSPEP